jgi:hypothetical protein
MATTGQMVGNLAQQKVAFKKKNLPPLGSGQRFANLSSKLAAQPGVQNPGALAASIGRKKYGIKPFQQLSAAGKRVP